MSEVRPPSASDSDADLLGSTRYSSAGFAVFYDRYETAVLGYFMGRTGNPEVAADLTAETFAAALANARRYRPAASTAAGWLFTIAHNKLVGSVRRGRVEARARQRLGIREAVEYAADDLERITASCGGDGWVEDLLMRLPAEQRDAVRARVLEERDYSEIAGDLRTSELVVRKRVSRGLAKLREELEDG